MRGKVGSALAAFALLASGCSDERQARETGLTGLTVEYGRSASGARLSGVLYLPKGPGPFPVLLYAHGSAAGSLSNEAFEAVAPPFNARGWALFAPYRRGQGLSRAAGPYIRDEIARARSAGGRAQAQDHLARLLATDHMDDQSQAFGWLSRQRFADRRRIAVMGNSFGGIIAVLSAQKLAICAAVDAAGAAESWADAPSLRRLMTEAATEARAPILFIQAENDFDLAPSRLLHAAMRRAGKRAEIRLYPRFGSSARAGHAFVYKGVEIWADDVHAFLARACP
jgi:carboxymethylenebutenolidase